jgi:hypothetical protein
MDGLSNRHTLKEKICVLSILIIFQCGRVFRLNFKNFNKIHKKQHNKLNASIQTDHGRYRDCAGKIKIQAT